MSSGKEELVPKPIAVLGRKMRMIPICTSLSSSIERVVVPTVRRDWAYEQVRRWFDQVKYISLTLCYCRDTIFGLCTVLEETVPMLPMSDKLTADNT